MSAPSDATFFGFYDPDKKRPATDKLADGIERYRQKFHAAPSLCLCSPADAEVLGPEVAGLRIEGRSYVGRSVFYLGRERTA